MKRHLAVIALLGIGLCLSAWAQWKEPPSTGSPANQLPDRTILAEQAGLGPLLSANLVEAESNGKNHKAIVEVQTDGVTIVDPAPVNGEPNSHQAHIQYRLDNGPIQNSTSKTWTFEHLSSGRHLIRVALASSDNRQMGKERSFEVKIP